MKFLIFVTLSLFSISCYTVVEKSIQEDKSTLNSDREFFVPSIIELEEHNLIYLLQKWIHSREEEKDSIRIYRPAGSRDFPPSRFRRVMEFISDGRLKFLQLAGNDAHYYDYGEWGLSKKDNSVIGIKDSPKRILKIKLLVVNQNILKFVSL